MRASSGTGETDRATGSSAWREAMWTTQTSTPPRTCESWRWSEPMVSASSIATVMPDRTQLLSTMNTRLYSDGELTALRSMPKRIINPRARWSEKPRERPVHRQRNFQASGQQDEEARFSVYQRQNLNDDSDFSCGISYLPPSGPSLTLARYNGPSHEHGDIAYRPHIHRASERAIETGRKPESEAEATSRFENIEGALACLTEDFNVAGLDAQNNDQLRLL